MLFEEDNRFWPRGEDPDNCDDCQDRLRRVVEAKDETTFLRKTNSGFRVSKKRGPESGLGIEAALTAPNIKRFRKTAAVFPSMFVFCNYLQPGKAKGLWRWSNFPQ